MPAILPKWGILSIIAYNSHAFILRRALHPRLRTPILPSSFFHPQNTVSPHNPTYSLHFPLPCLPILCHTASQLCQSHWLVTIVPKSQSVCVPGAFWPWRMSVMSVTSVPSVMSVTALHLVQADERLLEGMQERL